MHKLLERQLKKASRFSSDGKFDYDALIEMVSQTYEEFDKERRLNDRSMELISKELLELNRKIQEQSEARVQAIMNNVIDGIITFDEHGIIESFNPAAERIFGCSAAEVVGVSMYLLIPELREDTSKYLNTKQGVRHEVIGEHRDGSFFFIDLTISEMRLGERRLFIGVVRDITERKQAEEALQTSEERFRTLVANTPGAVQRCANDRYWTMHFISDAIKDISGYPASDFIQNRVRTYASIIHPEDAEMVYRMVQESMDAKQPYVLEYRIIHADGSVRWVYDQGQGVFGKDGELLWLDGAIFDITERRRAEAELVRLASFPEQNPNPVIEIDIAGKASYANPTAKMRFPNLHEAGFKHPALEGIQQTISALHKGRQESLTREIDLGNAVYEQKIWYVSESKVIRVYMADITERKRAEEILRENLVQLSKKNRYETIISSVTQSVHKSINLQEVLENAVEAMSKNVDVVEHVGIHLVEGEEAVMRAHRGHPDWFVNRVRRIPYPKGFTWKTIIEGKTTYCPDVDQDTVIGPAGREVGTKSYLSIPIHYRDTTVGCLNVHSFKKNAFDEEELKLLEIVAQQIEVALNNAQIAEAMRQSEERYRTLFDQSPVGVYIYDSELRITQCNERMAEILGSSRDNIIGLDMRKLKDQSFMPTMKKVLKGEICRYESFYEATTSSAKLWLSLSLSPLRDNNGNVIGGMAVVEDITERKQAEELFRTLSNNSPIGIYITQDEKFQFINPQFQNYTGYGQDELLGTNSLRLIFVEDRAAVRENAIRMLRGERSSPYEYRIVNSNGEVRWVMETVTSIQYEGRQAALGSCMDITEGKQAQELFKTLSSNSPIGIYIVQDKRFQFINPQFQNYTGYGENDLLGASPWKLVFSKDREAVRENAIRMLRGERSSPYEYRIVNSNGEIRWVMETVTSIQYEGRRAVLGSFMDITEHKRAEAFLRASEEKFRALAETANDAIVSADSSGNIIYFNRGAESIFGYSASEVVGKPLTSIIPEGFQDAPVQGLMSYLSTGKALDIGKTVELVGMRKNGYEFPIEISLASWRTGEETFFTGILRDTTQRKQAEADLKKAKEAAEVVSLAKSEFLANMSHEIRTPMNAIVGMADLLSETQLTSEQGEYVQTFRRAGDTLLNLINDILDLSKIESGCLDLDNTEFDLREVIEKTTEFLAVGIHRKDLELVCHVSPDVPACLVGDPNRLRQIIINLLGNATKFTEKGEVVLEVKNEELGVKGEETMTYHSENCKVQFSVRDTGIGIAPEKLDTIFDSFTQADSSITRKYGGTGLGLTISKRLVELMGGRIWVESKVGEGSTFYFSARFGVQTGPKRRIIPSIDLRELKILVVDDNATNRLILREMLTAHGFLVTEAESGKKGIEKIKLAKEAGVPYQLLLLDCRMPGMNGFQLVEFIKNELNITDMTIMMLTSDNRRDDILRCQELGISAYLVKPIKQYELFEAIITAIGKTKISAPVVETPTTAMSINITSEDQRTLRILLVEDSEDNRLLIKSYLKKTPLYIDIAENGEIAVEKFKSEKYDLVLMDMQMPVMDGYSATRTIRMWESERGINSTPIIALTAYALKEEMQKSLDAGCTAHITKPIKKATLMKTIHEYIRNVPS